MTALVTLLLLQVGIAALRQRSATLRRLLNFKPETVIDGGRVHLPTGPLSSQITWDERESKLRGRAVFDLEAVALVVVEPTGELSVRRRQRRDGNDVTRKPSTENGDREKRRWRMIGFVVFGLVVGALARLLVPGRQHLSVLVTLGLGLVESVVGGVVANALGTGDVFERASSVRSSPLPPPSCSSSSASGWAPCPSGRGPSSYHRADEAVMCWASRSGAASMNVAHVLAGIVPP